jgi:hypothetical protein
VPKVHNWIYGLGGRDTDLPMIGNLIDQLVDINKGKESETVNLLGARL